MAVRPDVAGFEVSFRPGAGVGDREYTFPASEPAPLVSELAIVATLRTLYELIRNRSGDHRSDHNASRRIRAV